MLPFFKKDLLFLPNERGSKRPTYIALIGIALYDEQEILPQR